MRPKSCAALVCCVCNYYTEQFNSRVYAYVSYVLLGFLTGMTLTPELSSSVMSVPEDLVVRRMVALFDYDPWESSPNYDSEVSLTYAACMFLS